MQLTERETWGLIHGIGLGPVYLLAFLAAAGAGLFGALITKVAGVR